MEWLAIIAILVLYTVSCYTSYTPEIRQAWWYIPFGMVLGALINVVWFVTVKWLDEKQRIYVFNLMWDSVMVLIFYGMPVIFFGVKFDKHGWIGVFLIVAGLLLLKVRQ